MKRPIISGAGVWGEWVFSMSDSMVRYSRGFALWLDEPPLRPATRASSLVHSWAVPCSWAARPPLLAI